MIKAVRPMKCVTKKKKVMFDEFIINLEKSFSKHTQRVNDSYTFKQLILSL